MIRLVKNLIVPRIWRVRVRTGRPGTIDVANIIAKMIAAGAKDFLVRQTAIRIFRERSVPPKDRWGEVLSLFEWVQKNVRYTRDIHRVELLHTPRRMLELRAGDCDDMTILLGSMLKSTGHPIRIALVGFRTEEPHLYSHIYPEVLVGRRWVPLDATMPHRIGWAPPARWKRICNVSEEGIQ